MHLSTDNHRFLRCLIKATGFFKFNFVLSGIQKPQQTPAPDVCTFPPEDEGFPLLFTRPRESRVFTRVNISRSTISLHQIYLTERELQSEAYSNLQQAGIPGQEDKRENMIGNREKKKKTRTLQLIFSFLHGMALYSDHRESSRGGQSPLILTHYSWRKRNESPQIYPS